MNQREDIMANFKLPMPMWEFVAIVAGLMSLNALAIDTMLPALGQVQDYYQLANPNDQQLVLYAYIFGIGAPQLVFGPLSDSLGRRKILFPCLIAYIVLSFACMFAGSFIILLLFRFLQGLFASGIRVVAASIIRDLVVGRAMARVMSLVLTVFMIVPMIAPAIGQGIMVYVSWQWTFGVLGIGGSIMILWTFIRLPETLDDNHRKELNLGEAFTSYKNVMSYKVTIGYLAASGVIFGCLFAFISASEQIFSDVFNQGDKFALLFALIAGCLAIGNMINASLVERYGMRRISHIIVVLFILSSGFNFLATTYLGARLEIFLPLFAISFGCFGMMGSNFSAIAMEPQGDNVASASAAYGFATTLLASIFGWIISSNYDETVGPILFGFVSLGILSLLIVFVTERGRLFGGHR